MKKILSIALIVVLVVIDQLTKVGAQIFLQGKKPFKVIRDIIELRYLEGGNTGAAFGIFSGNTLALGILSVVVSITLIVVLMRMLNKPDKSLICWTLVFIISGAVGNGIDRMLRKYVIDFIYVPIINFPIFNVADMYVTCAAIVLFLLVVFEKKENEITEEKEEV